MPPINGFGSLAPTGGKTGQRFSFKVQRDAHELILFCGKSNPGKILPPQHYAGRDPFMMESHLLPEVGPRKDCSGCKPSYFVHSLPALYSIKKFLPENALSQGLPVAAKKDKIKTLFTHSLIKNPHLL
jgi:hypothetical protein